MLREWRLEEVLGVGGFGIVYLGRGTYFGEQVAIKEYFPSAISDRIEGETVKPSDSSSEEIYSLGLEKFLEEAKLLWQLSQPERHPNIVSVRSLFEINGTAYIVMDFESGKSLSQMLKEGRKFDEASLLALIKPIAEGLDRAHRAGVVHRDIKPANILVDDNGRPVLIDFGSARFESGQATSTKVTFYTPPYAAIEQYIKTYPQGPWTDIYALGVALYQCITGEKPPEVLERLHGELGESLASREWPGFSRPFLRAVDAAMGIRPTERPQSIREWLKLFDAPDVPEPVEEPLDEEATRVSNASVLDEATRASAAAHLDRMAAATAALIESAASKAAAPAPAGPSPAAATSAPAAKSTAATEPTEPASANPLQGLLAAMPGGRVGLIGAGAGGVVLIGLLALLLAPKGPHPHTATASSGAALQIVAASEAPAAAASSAVAASAAPVAAGAPAGAAAAGRIEQQAHALLAAAAQAGRPSAETSGMSGGVARIGALAAQARGLTAGPDGDSKASALLTQINAEANSIARNEAAALEQTAAAQASQSTKVLGDLRALSNPQAEHMVSAVERSQAQLSRAVAGAAHSSDGGQALKSARAAIEASGKLTDAYAEARSGVAAVKRATLSQLVNEVRTMEAAVTAGAGGSKPGLFSSRQTKDNYQRIQENAAKARSQMAELEQLARSAAGGDADQLQAALVRGASIRQSMSLLRADSAAAASSGKDKSDKSDRSDRSDN